jgi:threonine synthase
MDIQIASNFERLIYDLNDCNDEKTIEAMMNIKKNGKYTIIKENLNKIKIDFLSSRMDEKEILKTIKDVFERFKIVLDPHTAIGYGAFDKVDLDGNNIVLATAHPSKFPVAIEKAINFKAELPDELLFVLDEKEKYDIIENDLNKIKQHIKEKIK